MNSYHSPEALPPRQGIEETDGVEDGSSALTESLKDKTLDTVLQTLLIGFIDKRRAIGDARP